jgi:succinoglycan biosynthesis protein ExoV
MTATPSQMRLVYYKSSTGNIGDDLNPWLWPMVFGAEAFSDEGETRFLGIGSIFTDGYVKRGGKHIVFGSGVPSPFNRPDLSAAEIDIRFVRGPLSSRMSKNAPWITDSAAIVPLFAAERTAAAPARRPAFVPHFRTPDDVAAKIAAELGLHLVKPSLSPERFLEELRGCDEVVAEAMHGAILADAFRIPWKAVYVTTPYESGWTSFFKWRDWLSSLGLPAGARGGFPLWGLAPKPWRNRLSRPSIAEMVERLGASIARSEAVLSDEAVLARAQDRIMAEARRLGHAA